MARETYYYSDATKTTQVGYKYEDNCTRNNWFKGVETAYYMTHRYPCYA